MYINMISITIICIIIMVSMIVYGLIINLEAMTRNKAMNPRAMFILMIIIAITLLGVLDHIDYNKSTPNEVYTNEDLSKSYNNGYNAGYEEAYATLDEWFSNLQSVTIGEDNSTIHILDNNGEEWILVSDDYQN